MTSDVVLWDIRTLWSSAPCSHMLAVQWLGSTIYSLNHFPVQNSITNRPFYSCVLKLPGLRMNTRLELTLF